MPTDKMPNDLLAFCLDFLLSFFVVIRTKCQIMLTWSAKKRQKKLRRTKCQMTTKKSEQNASKSFGILSFGILSIGILSYHLSKMPTHSKYVDNSWRIFSFVWSKLVICLFKACFAVTLAEALISFLVSLAKFVVCVCFLFFIDFTFQPPKYVVSPSKTITLTYNWYNLKW